MSQVLNKSRGWYPDAVYIGRGSKWGNPFRIGRDGTREQVIAKYCHWRELQPALIRAAREELAGKDLLCFCAPRACHGDVLHALANPHNSPNESK